MRLKIGNHIMYNKLITRERWYSERIAGTSKKLFNDSGESYDEYLTEYKSMQRDKKINEILTKQNNLD